MTFLIWFIYLFIYFEESGSMHSVFSDTYIFSAIEL